MKHSIIAACLGALCILAAAALAHAADSPEKNRDADFDQFVAQTHKDSLKLRETALHKTIAKDTCWPRGVWGDNLWCLAALYLNEKVDMANALSLAHQVGLYAYDTRGWRLRR